MSENKVKKILRIVPCPSYDVEGMESWLSDMAEKGWILAEDGIKLGVAVFEKSQPAEIRYCLTGAKNGTRYIDDNYGEPEYEEMKHSEKFGWRYVAKRGGFHIYKNADPNARALDTDPYIQALTLKTVGGRQGALAAVALVWLAFNPLFRAKFNVIGVSVQVSSWLFLAWLISVLWILAGVIIRCAYLTKLGRRLKETGIFEDGKDRSKFYGINILRSVVSVIMVVVFLFGSGAVYFRNRIERETDKIWDFSGDVPFATVADFVSDGTYSVNYDTGNNFYSRWSDLLSPVCIIWDELGEVRTDYGGGYSCWLTAEYYEMQSGWLAKCLAKEFYSDRFWNRRCETFAVDVNTDFGAGYYDSAGTAVIILQDGNKVVCMHIMELGIFGDEPEYYIELSGQEYAEIAAEKFLK